MYVCQCGARDCSTKCVDVPSLVAIAKGSRSQAALEQEVAPVDLEHCRHLLVEVRRVCFNNCYLFGVELRQHELVLNPSVLFLDPLVLLEKLELPLLGLFSLPLSLGRDFRRKELASSNRKDQGDDNNDDHGGCDGGAAIPQRLEDVDVFVLGGCLDEVESATYFTEFARCGVMKGERNSRVRGVRLEMGTV